MEMINLTNIGQISRLHKRGLFSIWSRPQIYSSSPTVSCRVRHKTSREKFSFQKVKKIKKTEKLISVNLISSLLNSKKPRKNKNLKLLKFETHFEIIVNSREVRAARVAAE